MELKQLIYKETEILGYEPYFEKYITVASINTTTKEVRPTHGYFYPHEYGKRVKKWCEKQGYLFNNN